jgi:hypothetical protein
MPNNRAIADRHHRLWAILRLLAKTRALTTAENNDFHVFKEFTLAAYALEKANDQMAEISMRLKQLKHFLHFFTGYNNPLRINTIVRMDQKIPHSWPFTP